MYSLSGYIQTTLKNITPLLQYTPEGRKACDKNIKIKF